MVRKQDGWWEGVLNEKRGIFPDTFVRPIDKEPSAVVYRNRKDSSRIRRCRVAFSYKQDHEDELNLNVGDIIEVLGEEEEGWWRGVLNGKEGVFPSNFVVEIKSGSSREDLANTIDEKLPSLPPKPGTNSENSNYFDYEPVTTSDKLNYCSCFCCNYSINCYL